MDITIEYLSPSLPVKKANGDYRLVTVFLEVECYSKSQSALILDINSTVRRIALWEYIITTGLTHDNNDDNR